MVLEFFLLFKCFNFFFLPEDKTKVIKKAEIILTKVIVLFEYKKANKNIRTDLNSTIKG